MAAAEAVLIAQYTLAATVWPDVALPGLGVTALLGLLGIRAGLRHKRYPCEKCIADMPLDAQAQAARKRLSLRLHHWLTSRAWLAVAATGCLVTVVLPSWARTLVLTALSVPVLVGFVVGWRHQPLQLVCRWCNRRDEDDDDQVPEPTPVPDPAGAKTA